MSFEVQNNALSQQLKLTAVPETTVNPTDDAEEKNIQLVEDSSVDEENELITVNKDIEDIGITDAAAIDYFDADGNGKVSLSEFIGGILNMFGITGEEKTDDTSDVDNDQNTDEPSETEGADDADAATDAEEPAAEDKTAELDANGDGIITQEEIDAYNYKTQDKTADLDLNGDGKITQEEIDTYNKRHADAPVDEEPSTDAPVDEEPSADAPVDEEPSADAPVDEEPSTDAPVDEEPSADAPVDEEPSTDAPVDEEPSTDAPSDSESDISVLDYDGDHIVTQEEMQRYIDENGVAAFYNAFGELLGDNDIEY